MAALLEKKERMTAARVLLVAAIIALPAPATIEGAQDPPQPKFRSSVEVVSVSAVVKDRNGKFVRNLVQNDFVIQEGGHERKILDFRAETDGPVKLGLLVDASGSMRVGNKAMEALATARHLFGALKPDDQAALFSFDTRLDHVSDFTSDVGALEQSLTRLNPPFGQTSLYDAIAEAAAFVAESGRKATGLPQRTALVVLTDGIDTRSRLTTEQVAAAASRIDVPVYVIAVMSSIDDPRVDDSPALDVSGLRQLAQHTGGELYIASAPAHASVASRQIVDELRHQYVLAFEASTRGGGWRPLEVRARNKKLVVRARTGYVAGNSDRPTPGLGSGMPFCEHAALPAAAWGEL
jgi:VWFA-related protein